MDKISAILSKPAILLQILTVPFLRHVMVTVSPLLILISLHFNSMMLMLIPFSSVLNFTIVSKIIISNFTIKCKYKRKKFYNTIIIFLSKLHLYKSFFQKRREVSLYHFLVYLDNFLNYLYCRLL